jgi:hypothetical protein
VSDGVDEDDFDEDGWDESAEWQPLPEWLEQPDGSGEKGAVDAAADRATSGERLLYALGQMYALWHRGQLAVAPRDFDIEDLARIIGVWPELEFVTDDQRGTRFHFSGEVVCFEPDRPFPWRLLSSWEWAAEQDAP